MHLKDPVKDERRHQKQLVYGRKYRKTPAYRAVLLKYRRSVKALANVRKQHLKTKYGITPEQYDVMFAQQGGVCAICGGAETNKRNKLLCVDHNHKTTDLRGLLCNNCNKAIGLMQDSPMRLQKAIEYLNRYSKGELQCLMPQPYVGR